MRNFLFDNDSTFDNVLKNAFSETPPDHILNSTNPWNKALNYITIGFVISLVNIDYGNLNYITSVIGLLLLLLGFRILRAENKWFLACWLISIVRIILLYPNYIANATIYSSEFASNMSIQIPLAIVSIAATLSLYVCFYKGLCKVAAKSESAIYLQDVKDLAKWYGLSLIIFSVSLVVFSTIGILLSTILILIAYGGILYNLYKVLQTLKEIGYLAQTTKLHFPDFVIILIVCGSLLLGIGCGYLFADDFETTIVERDRAAHQELYHLKEDLDAKGLDKEILNTFTPEDVAILENAEEIIIQKDDSNSRLTLIHIAAKLADEPETWKIYHYIPNIDLSYYTNGLDAIELRTPDQIAPEDWELIGEITGHIGGASNITEYSSIETITYQKDGWFDDPREITSTFLSFNTTGNNRYLSYQVKALREDATLQADITYIHQIDWKQYPVQTPVEAYTSNFGLPTDVFHTLTKHFELDMTK